MVNVVLAGGGTAGHIEPAMNLADALRRGDPQIGITALGTSKGLESSLIPERGYELAMIPAVPLPRRPSGELLTLPGRMRGALAQTRAILTDVGADVVVGFGGYVALPAYLAARKLKIPIVIHEANARAGLANKVGARFTPFIGEAVAGSLPGGTRMGIPLRASIAGLDRHAMARQARIDLGLDPDKATLLVFGGSQGAVRINSALNDAIGQILALDLQVLHAVGPKNLESAAVGVPGYFPRAYLNRMDLAYSAADLALCRSGALTCAELAAVGLPAIYVPFPIGNGEQRLNALPVVEAGGGLLVADEDLTAASLLANLTALVSDSGRLAHMGQMAAQHGVRDADQKLAEMVYEAIKSGKTSGGRK